ncbi:ClpX C4-type zinc finger protein [Citrobacter freundii]|jgi:hypothetical protein|uniref:ClpX C4-type zinc finger protein n=1 Tax=Citrobacter freundii complex TaxID=1344959 RepID=UPI001C97163E|nr:ClpX C4-type zinc finger protein [Citrobacter freundii]EKT8697129.1 ClpX C4-type zinc finger protein [Citrobacter freundii]EKU4668914.1 ClpX C4-type zinc finger protein [Citrobacter freundii]EKY0313924.1 ClpX C4-type zinc finger protein [Citrobacter freundii]ELT3494559.1 ClpX C4-type zinc finger protein [Citrobacter freundii]ELW9331399.1 ClpX C4-type zinc finger protein [Citrobacter freundii]
MPEQMYDPKSLKLLGITARLQTLMINQKITPLELVNCANAARAAWLTTTNTKNLERVEGIYCDFCNRDTTEEGILFITGNRNAHICDKCVDLCREILAKKRAV